MANPDLELRGGGGGGGGFLSLTLPVFLPSAILLFFFYPKKKGGEPVSGEDILSNSYRGGCYSEEYYVFSFWKLDSFNPYYDNDKKKNNNINEEKNIK